MCQRKMLPPSSGQTTKLWGNGWCLTWRGEYREQGCEPIFGNKPPACSIAFQTGKVSEKC